MAMNAHEHRKILTEIEDNLVLGLQQASAAVARGALTEGIGLSLTGITDALRELREHKTSGPIFRRG